MFFAHAGFGTFSKTAVTAANPFNVARRVVWLAGLLMVSYLAMSGQSLNVSFKEYPLPNANSCPDSLVTGPDGALWFTGGCLGRIVISR